MMRLVDVVLLKSCTSREKAMSLVYSCFKLLALFLIQHHFNRGFFVRNKSHLHIKKKNYKTSTENKDVFLPSYRMQKIYGYQS